MTAIGGRVRLGLRAVQPLAAEVTEAAVQELGLTPGSHVVATFKAATTRLVLNGNRHGTRPAVRSR